MGPIEDLELPVFKEPKLNVMVSKRSRSEDKQLLGKNVEKTPKNNQNLG